MIFLHNLVENNEIEKLKNELEKNQIDLNSKNRHGKTFFI